MHCIVPLAGPLEGPEDRCNTIIITCREVLQHHSHAVLQHMSKPKKPITCRQCGNTINRTQENCPHCGASTGGRRGKLALLVIGSLVIIFSLLQFENLWVFAVIGLIIVLVGANGLYERRKRIQEAEAEIASGSTGEPDSTGES